MAATQTLPNPGCVLKVGDGRGFLIEYRAHIQPMAFPRKRRLRLKTFSERRLVVTAAHCLPQLPPAHGAAHYWERTYKGLLGSLDGSKKDVWAECLFVDPVADIAILDCPDEQELDEHADAYHALIDSAPALRIGHVRTGCGWVLTLDGHWVRTTLYVFSGMYRTSLSIGPTKPGMSGSPILNEAGRAVGVVTLGEETVNSTGERQEEERQGPQAILAHNLPGWLLNAAHPHARFPHVGR